MPRFAKGDIQIVYWLAKLGVTIPDDLAFLTGRDVQIIWRRLRALKEMGDANFCRHPENPFQRIWFLRPTGWKLAEELEAIPEAPAGTDEKSPVFISHDLVVSQVFVALTKMERQGLLKELKFTRLFSQLYHRWGEAE